jgi:hypothetical protein
VSVSASEWVTGIGTLALAVATTGMVRQTRFLVENAQQPLVVPDIEAKVPAHYDFAPGGTPGGFSTYQLSVRNVGPGVAVIGHTGWARLVDPSDPLSLAYPGSIIIGPAEAAVIELHGTHQPVPRFDILLRYPDLRVKRRSETEIPYISSGEAGDPYHADVFPLNPTFRAKATRGD